MDPNDINKMRKHIFSTYTNLRFGIGFIAIAFPVLLYSFGKILTDTGLQGSMSAYYHTSSRPLFVGILFAVGVFLYLYKGFDKWENLLLNLAGILAVMIALLPTGLTHKSTDCVVPLEPVAAACLTTKNAQHCRTIESPENNLCNTVTAPKWHAYTAIAFFVSIAIVAIFLSRTTLRQVKSEVSRRWYKRAYIMLGVFMVLIPLMAAVTTELFQYGRDDPDKTGVFWIELAAIWVFGAYWILKGIEIKNNHADDYFLGISQQ